jgi:hypothetical protein
MTLLFKTPLQIRMTVRRARSCPGPFKILLKLVWPIPWHFKLVTPQMTLDELRGNQDVVRERQGRVDQLQEIPLFKKRDTPTRSLYRMYENLSANLFPRLGLEVEYFYFHTEPRWALEAIPDPKDEDPVRYAILASLVEALAGAFNWRLSLGLLRDGSKVFKSEEIVPYVPVKIPEWAKKVAAVGEGLVLLEEGMTQHSELNFSEPFQRRNITTSMGYLYTL